MTQRIKIEDIGKVGKLTPIKEVERKQKNYRRFLWRCDCGNEKEINLSPVKRGNTTSCGCAFKKHAINQKRGAESGSWKGGRRIEEGYVLVYYPDNHHAKSNGYVREHRYVMSEFLKRPLEKHENVHHINGDKLDNRIENLELWSTSQPCGQRIKDKLKWAKEIISKYQEINYE